MRPGYLRKNGVPYSEDASLTEYFNRHDEPNGDQWITVTRVIDDPKYLNQTYVVSESFKKESDTSKWRPHPAKSIRRGNRSTAWSRQSAVVSDQS